MKYFILKFLIGFFCIFILFTLYSQIRLYVTYQNPYSSWALSLNGNEVFKSIYKSKKHKKVKKLIIGDSVAEQLYSANEYNDSIYSLTCNQSIALAGHYCLLDNFLKINKDSLPEEVILFYNPFSLQNNLDKFAFHYFLKTLYYNNEYENCFDSIVSMRVKEIPYYYTAKLSIIKSINYSPSYTLPDENGDDWLSPISKSYLPKILKLCNDNHIKFVFIPSPIKMSRKSEINAIFNDTTKIMHTYIEKISFMNDTLFIDQGHFKHNYIPVDYLKLKSL